MLYSMVTVAAQAPDGSHRQFWFIFASSHADIAAIHADLEASGVAYGWRLDTEWAGERRRETKRYPLILGAHGLVSIQPVRHAIITAEGVIA